MTNTIPPTQDRDCYASLDTYEMLEAVRYAVPDRINWQEMCMALADRLRKTQRELEGVHYDQLSTRDY